MRQIDLLPHRIPDRNVMIVDNLSFGRYNMMEHFYGDKNKLYQHYKRPYGQEAYRYIAEKNTKE